MAKRRNVIMALGALATGGGVVLGSGAVGASAQPGADMRIVAAAELVASRGEGWDDGQPDMSDTSIFSNGDFDGSAADLPVAFLNDAANDDLTIEIASRNEASEHVWEDLIEIENTGTSDVDIRIDYAEYGDEIAESYDGTEGSGDDLDRADAQSIFQFADADGTRLSPDPNDESDEGQNTLTVAAGSTEQITLKTDLTDDQVAAVNDATTVSNPWQSGGDTDGVQFLTEVELTNVE